MSIRFPKLRQQNTTTPSTGKTGCAQLEVESRGGHSITQVATVGRAPDSQICIDDRAVSRNHARIFFEGGHFWIKDLGSANGTTVNGKKVTLQMLADRDKIGFGGVKSIFHCSMHKHGPAPVAEDPLDGSDQLDPDGTPTGGLAEGHLPAGMTRRQGRTEKIQRSTQVTVGMGSELQLLTRKVESLQAENERLRKEISKQRGSTARVTGSKTSESKEVERLKRLVSQLERALADANTRIHNLQESLDREN